MSAMLLANEMFALTGNLRGQLADEVFERNAGTVSSAGPVGTIANEIAKRRAHAVTRIVRIGRICVRERRMLRVIRTINGNVVRLWLNLKRKEKSSSLC